MTFWCLMNADFYASDMVSPDKLASCLRITKEELACSVGLAKETLYRKNRSESQKVQTRLREMTDIISRVTPWAGSLAMAFAWYRSYGIPAFGGMTPEDVLKAGRSEALRDYISAINVGGYA